MPRISVHIATRNNERFIAEAIRSVLAEPYKDLELVVLDDASTDGNWTAILKAIEGAPNARAVRSEERLGVCKGRHRLLEISDSDYILPVDGDDLIIPGTLESRADFLDSRPSFAGAYGKIRQMDESGKDAMATMGLPFSRFNLPYEDMICHGGHLLRRADVVRAGGYQETGEGSNSIAEDLSLWYRLALDRDFMFFDRYVYLYRKYQGQITKSGKERFAKVAKLMMQTTIDARPDLAQPISQGRPLELSPEDFRAATLILGIYSRCVPPDSDIFAQLLSIASKTAPDDYGVLYRGYVWNCGRGNMGAALEACETMLASFGDSSILRMNALKMKRDALKAVGAPFDEAALEREIRKASAEYSELSLQ